MKPNLLQISLLTMFVLCVTGCWGGGARTVYVNRVTTIGQELSDLQAAHQKGAISDQEYAAQKEQILHPQPLQ